jgi:DnaJ-class molecular chaperone
MGWKQMSELEPKFTFDEARKWAMANNSDVNAFISHFKWCMNCRGTGKEYMMTQSEACHWCQGTGHSIICDKCNGVGHIGVPVEGKKESMEAGRLEIMADSNSKISHGDKINDYEQMIKEKMGKLC